MHLYTKPQVNSTLFLSNNRQNGLLLKKQKKNLLQISLAGEDEWQIMFEIFGIHDSFVMQDPRKTGVENKRGFVYFVTDGDKVKIGSSTYWRDRISSLQIGNPRELRVLRVFPTDYCQQCECALHHKYESVHVRGEWYDLAKYYKFNGCLDDIGKPIEGLLYAYDFSGYSRFVLLKPTN